MPRCTQAGSAGLHGGRGILLNAAAPAFVRGNLPAGSTVSGNMVRQALRVMAYLTLPWAWSCSGTPTGPTPDPSASQCSVFADPASSAYVLPWAVGARFRVSRSFGHYTPANDGVGLYALDFPMPIGTAVHAARAGEVVAVEERYADGDRATYHENWVMIRHADDTIGRYIHITRGGVLVEVGDHVMQGQLIARSGDSGPSGEPHLHFDVQTCGPNLPPAYNRLPCGMTVPVSFRNTAAHTCGLAARQSYTALPFTADTR
jgi:murein DD-endopeptidase MepM/ murein hydrolase activator NlpD